MTNIPRCAFYVCAAAALLITSCTSGHAPKSSISGSPVIAIISAINVEYEPLLVHLKGKQEETIPGVRFITGYINNINAVIASTGVAKANAAFVTTLLVEHFRPSLVIFIGIAGSLNSELHPGDIVVSDRVIQSDKGRLADGAKIKPTATHNPITNGLNPLYFEADERALQRAYDACLSSKFETIQTANGNRYPRCERGTVATGDVFVDSEGYRQIIREQTGAKVVEMEGGAVAQICHQLGTPWLIVRGISDCADSRANADVKKFADSVMENISRVVLGML